VISLPAGRRRNSYPRLAASLRAGLISSLVLLILVGLSGSVLLGQAAPAKAQVTTLLETEHAVPGTEARAALQVHLPEGFHVNSNRPSDPSLIPVRLELSNLPAGIEVAELVFPPPTELKQRGADQPLMVFERDFVIGVVFRVTAAAKAGIVSIPGRLRYQPCDESMCYFPTNVPAEWTLSVASAAGAKQHADVFGKIPFGTGESPAAAAAAAPVIAPRPATANAAGGEPPPTDEIAALAPFQVMGSTSGYLGSGDFLSFVHDAENGVRQVGLFEGRGPLAIILIVLVGGLALNLTPCVLPLVPINLAIIGAGAQAGSRMRGFLLGGMYGAAMAIVYGVLGLIVILTASTFGTINASPWFNLGIALLFVVLALAMFDVIVIDFSKYSDRFKVSDESRGSFLVAFTMGGVAALLAGACVAPVVVQVVLFSSNLYAAGTPAALALPFFLGIGMAIPWPIAGAGIAALPRPGAWMVRIKQAFGVIIFATAAYYGYEAYGLFANRWVDASEVSSSVEAKLKAGWYASMADGLAAAKAENKPVLIDMWATWCKNCLVMDRTTLQDQAVTTALDGYIKIKFQAEDPDDERVARVMQHMNAPGLPTYVILKVK
jgi:thiol:disulfide interchange protein DsbD